MTHLLIAPVDEEVSVLFKVIHESGMRFAKGPDLTSPRTDKVFPPNSLHKGVRKVRPSGSKIVFIELEDGKGWVFCDKKGKILDRFQEEEVLVEVTAEKRAEGEMWWRVISPSLPHPFFILSLAFLYIYQYFVD